jgi:hypothetical protein
LLTAKCSLHLDSNLATVNQLVDCFGDCLAYYYRLTNKQSWLTLVKSKGTKKSFSIIIIILVIKKAMTTSGATGSGGNNGSCGTKGSGESSGLIKVSNNFGTSIGPTVTAEVVIHPPLIAKIISLCGIPEDSMMLMFMFENKWTTLNHVLSADFDDINAFHTVKGFQDGLHLHVQVLIAVLQAQVS